MEYEYDFSKLRGKIKEICETQENWGSKMGFSGYSKSAKLNNRFCFKTDEIVKCCEILGIQQEEIGMYFFTLKNK